MFLQSEEFDVTMLEACLQISDVQQSQYEEPEIFNYFNWHEK